MRKPTTYRDIFSEFVGILWRYLIYYIVAAILSEVGDAPLSSIVASMALLLAIQSGIRSERGRDHD